MSQIKLEINFNALKSEVWNAISNPEAMKVWYFDIPDFKLQINHDFSFYESHGKQYLHVCKILDFEENKLLRHTWTHPEQSKGISELSWQIEEINANNTKVVLVHEGVDSFSDAGPNFSTQNFQMGWEALVKTSLRNYLYNIKKLTFSILIEAPAKQIWGKLWSKDSYSIWTNPFCEGTYFTGNIEQGSRIHFLTPTGSGMFSDVFYMIENKMIFFKHIGNVEKFQEMPLDEETSKWSGSFESYKLEEENGITKITAEIDCVPEYIDYMNDKFPLALQELKKISE